MTKSITANSSRFRSSAFVKQSYKRGMAIVGTSSIIVGFGLAGGTPAFAGAEVDCIGRTLTPGTPSANQLAIADKLNDGTGIVCLSGDFVIESTITFNSGNVRVYGIGNSSIEPQNGGVFHSEFDANSAPLHDIEIINLTVKNASRIAVEGGSVLVQDSIFSGNRGGAISAYTFASVDNSTFINNSSDFDSDYGEGSAIRVEQEGTSEFSLLISNSTFEGNQAEGDGGAIFAYSIQIENSTFFENTAQVGGAVYSAFVEIINSTFANNQAVEGDAEGGAIWAWAGQVGLSTFVNNLAGEPTLGADVPGNAIYKVGGGTFAIAGNIFAGTSPHPQLGTGQDTTPSPFEDFGGNVFSTSDVTEVDVDQHEGSVFGASLTSLFGTTSPALAAHAPNTSGTETIGLAAGSPAIDVMTAEIIADLAVDERALFDQRGAPRSIPFDAGAFEGSISLANTGNENPFWTAAASVTLIAVGGFVAAIASRLRRRTS
jgi:predicted outer membrane repeat protein